jgi:pilus assembly protein Flp/PilA
MLELLRRLQSDAAGQGLVEYVLIIALVAVALIAMLIVFRDAVAKVFGMVSDTLNETPICGQKGQSHKCF